VESERGLLHGHTHSQDDRLATLTSAQDQPRTDVAAQEEAQIYNEIRARKILEEEDRKLAKRLQEDLGGTSMMIQVKVPPGVFGGQFISVQVRGRNGFERVQIPPGVNPGESFMYVTSSSSGAQEGRAFSPQAESIRVCIPDGVTPGQDFTVCLPNGSQVSVVCPDGLKSGDPIDIPVNSVYMAATQTTPTPPAPLSERERKEREEFLAALPDDIRSEILAQELQREQPAQVGNQTSRQSPASSTSSDWVPSVQVEIPPGVYPGQQFRTVMPDGREVVLVVPPGFKPGDVLGVPKNVGMQNQSHPPAPAPAPAPPPVESTQSRQEREEFLAALPDDIREEILRAEEQQETASITVEQTENSQTHGTENVTTTSKDEEGALLDFSESEDTTSLSVPPPAPVVNDLLAMDSPNMSVPAEGPGGLDYLNSTVSSGNSGFDFMGTQAADSQNVQHSSTALNSGFDFVNDSAQKTNDLVTEKQAEQQVGANSVKGGTETKPTDQFASLSIATAATMVPNNPTEPKPPLERLKEAKASLDKGQITQEEFNAIKKEVIAAI